mgnify:CR=1 FL=1
MNGLHQSCSGPHIRPDARVWDTADVADTDAFQYYREGICAAFMPLRPEVDRARRTSFHARLMSLPVGEGVLNLVASKSHEVHRGRAEIAATPQDCYYLNLQLSGECRISQGGESIVLKTGEIGLFDGSHAFDIDHSACRDFSVASLMLPKQAGRDGLPQGAPLKFCQGGDYGRLLAETARTLARRAARNNGDDFDRLYTVILSLAALAAGDRQPTGLGADRPVAHVLRLRGILARRCADPDFTIGDLAAEAGLSPGYIRNLCTRNGEAFGDMLRAERLALAARLLGEQRHAHLPVASVGYMAGFRDASHFGRSFREVYGMSPGNWRRQGLV